MAAVGKPCGQALDFALAFISALRAKHDIRGPMSAREIADLSRVVSGSRGCTKQNIARIEHIALRKVCGVLTRDGSKEQCREALASYSRHCGWWSERV